MRTITLALSAAAGLAACATVAPTKQEQLEQVAKDWCAMIRASQIVPVYPLNQDVQPGDIFLVRTTIDHQQDEYRKKGYLPLDKLLVRLHPNYENFYAHSLGVGGTGQDIPAIWIDKSRNWDGAPLAAFPSYSFKVSRELGFNLAVPVSAVNIGLDLLGKDEAEASVAIRDARNYGIDIAGLLPPVLAWAAQNQPLLNSLPPACTGAAENRRCQYNYLRVVNRVYLARTLAVSVASSTAASAGLKGRLGVPATVPAAADALGTLGQAVDLRGRVLDRLNAQSGGPKGEQRKALEQIRGTLDGIVGDARSKSLTKIPVSVLNQPLGDLTRLLPTLKLAEGSVHYTSFSERSVSMDESFDMPIVIGYVGFDLPVLADGRLGGPQTLAVLSPEHGELVGVATLNPVASTYRQALEMIAARADADRLLSVAIARLAADTGAANLGSDWSKAAARRASGSQDAVDAFRALIAAQAKAHVLTLDQAAAALNRALGST